MAFLLSLFCCVRQKLRRLEAALIEYRESLEDRGIKNQEEIEKKVALHRKKLESDYGISNSGESILNCWKTNIFRRSCSMNISS